MTTELQTERRVAQIEPFITLKEAAAQLHLPYFKLQRAAAAGRIPTYCFYNGRQLVRISEINDVIETSRQGGGDDH